MTNLTGNGYFTPATAAASAYGLFKSQITMVCSGAGKTAGGRCFEWVREKDRQKNTAVTHGY